MHSEPTFINEKTGKLHTEETIPWFYHPKTKHIVWKDTEEGKKVIKEYSLKFSSDNR